jgi:hypothetical protein
MTVDTQDLDDMLDQIRQLPPEYRLRLMREILETLILASPPPPLEFCALASSRISTGQCLRSKTMPWLSGGLPKEN